MCAFCALTYAGSENYSGKDIQAAPPPPACPDWTGFYIGGDVGYKHSTTDLSLNLFGNWDTPGNDVDKAEIQRRAPGNLDNDALEAGGVIGYNAQVNHIVVGLEASGNYLWAHGFDNTEEFTVPHPLSQDSVINLATSFRTHYLVTVAPRIGYAFCRFLPYITGGLAIGDVDFSQGIFYHNPAALGFAEEGSTSETKAGWMVGGGLQYALTDHWSLRAQYQYIDLGTADFRSVGSATFPGFFGDHQISLKEHNASFAVIYKF